jgi:hypothetical protein
MTNIYQCNANEEQKLLVISLVEYKAKMGTEMKVSNEFLQSDWLIKTGISDRIPWVRTGILKTVSKWRLFIVSYICFNIKILKHK